MHIKIISMLAISSFFVGCASVPVANPELSQTVKKLNPPSEGHASIYIYRSDSVLGASLKKDIWIDGQCVGESARGVFFHQQVVADKKHIISTESEFSANHLELQTESGKQYFIQQFIKMGALVGAANLRQVDEVTGKQAVNKYAFAQGGHCSKAQIDLTQK